MTTQLRHYTFDKALQLKDAGLVAATAAAQVAGVDKILDVGTGRIDSRAILDVTAIEKDTGDEIYRVQVQGSNSATFANTVVNLAEKSFGKAALTGESVDSVVGRFEVPFTNDMNGTVFEFIRIKTVVVGTIATGINFSAFLAKK